MRVSYLLGLNDALEFQVLNFEVLIILSKFLKDRNEFKKKCFLHKILIPEIFSILMINYDVMYEKGVTLKSANKLLRNKQKIIVR